MSKRRVILILGIAILTIGSVGGYVLTANRGLLSEVNSAKILAVARAHPNFTLEQRRAVAAEINAEVYPTWQSLSLSGRVARLASLARKLLTSGSQDPAAPVQATANFVGNQTTINNPSFGFVALQRQANCALTLYEGGYSFGAPLTFQVQSTTTSFELALHNAAGLATRADLFAGGCQDSSTAIGARTVVSLGSVGQNEAGIAASIYDDAQNNSELFTANVNLSTMTMQSLNVNLSAPGVTVLAAGNLNGNGTPGIVGFDPTAGSITVSLVGANGAIGAAASYAVPGTNTEALVLADVNGDGKLDAVVATVNASGQESISVLTGRGDGTFNPAQTFAVATPTMPPSGTPAPIVK